jgi:hypothetical protein
MIMTMMIIDAFDHDHDGHDQYHHAAAADDDDDDDVRY